MNCAKTHRLGELLLTHLGQSAAPGEGYMSKNIPKYLEGHCSTARKNFHEIPFFSVKECRDVAKKKVKLSETTTCGSPDGLMIFVCGRHFSSYVLGCGCVLQINYVLRWQTY